jgi:CRP-like cAMP-binding protein
MPARPLFFGPLLYFRTVPALDRLSSALLGAIAQHAEEVFFPAGSPLLEPDRPREAFFVIVEGKVSVRDPGGREELLGPGEALGFLHLLARSEEALDARAVWDTVALRVDWDAHMDACERHFPILEVHMGFLAQRCLEELRRIRRALPGPSASSGTGEDGESPHQPRLGTSSPTPLNLVRKLEALHRSQVFPSSSMDALAELTRHLEEVRHPPGSTFWAEGDPSGSFLLIASGELVLEGPKGGWRETLGPGEVAGQLEALARVPREGSLRAELPTVTLRVDLEPFFDIMEDHFNMAVEVTAGLARGLMELQSLGPPPPPRAEIL